MCDALQLRGFFVHLLGKDVETLVRNFNALKNAVQARVNALINMDKQLYVVDVPKDDLWNLYIEAFPVNDQQQHRCSACRQFVKSVGGLVTIDGNYNVRSIWDIDPTGDAVYDDVAMAMKSVVESASVSGCFVTDQLTHGIDSNPQKLKSGEILRWHHFFLKLPNHNRHICGQGKVGEYIGHNQAQSDVLRRGLEELTLDSVNTVIELVTANNIYTGGAGDILSNLEEFKRLKLAYADVPDHLKPNFVWAKSKSHVAKLRNSSVGTLLIDLSEGRNLEASVKKFEAMVGGQNYRRPTALITERMIQGAQATIAELGLTESLGRRAAKLRDVTVNNVEFVDRDARGRMATGTPFDLLKATVPAKLPGLDRVREVSLEEFRTTLLPTATKLELLLENRMASNLVSLVAPLNPDAPSLFRWENGFSWCYQTATADSVKERVKAAGGRIEGFARFSLEWFNYDDLDLHMNAAGEHIYFRNKVSRNKVGNYCTLDVDMNVGGNLSRSPVENIVFPYGMDEGHYKLWVNQYARRETINSGFRVEFEHDGQTVEFESAVSPREGKNIDILEFDYSRTHGIQIVRSMTSDISSKEIWGLRTNGFVPVKLAMLSPNYWDGSNDTNMGNKHFFMFLDGANNDGAIRGFFNEFLNGRLSEHRKVFEALAAKMEVKKEEGEEELSGLGFSLTMPNNFKVRMTAESVQSVFKVIV